MTIEDLTKVEKRFAKNYFKKRDMKYDPKNLDIKIIREKMRRSAYHEAGHFSARVFTRFEINNIQSITIIPDERTIGQMRCKDSVTETYLDKVPAQKLFGYMLLLELFAGFGANMIHKKAKYNNLIDYLCEEEDEEWYNYYDEKGSDISEARRIADILSKPLHLSQYRILSITARWTLEMLNIPSIWNIVETTAKILLSKGEVTLRNREISKLAYDSSVPNILSIPKWKKRMHLI
jgi:hypothetical protein